MRECADFRSQMIAYVRGELLPLERAHLESHVARCRSCAVLEKKCSRAFEAVELAPPRIEAAHLDRLKKRLRPYIADARPVRPSYVPIGGLAFACALAAVAIVVLLLPREETVIVEQAAPLAVVEQAVAAPVSIEHRAIGEHLHVLSAQNWDGHVVNDAPSDLQLEMKKGFAVMAFKGGEGRKLTVFAPNVEVEVIGTKFFVNVLANGATAVGVVSGRVRVHHPGGSELVEAGTSRSYGEAEVPMPAGPSATPAVDLDDAFIADHGHDATAALGGADGDALAMRDETALAEHDALAMREDAKHSALGEVDATRTGVNDARRSDAPRSGVNDTNATRSGSATTRRDPASESRRAERRDAKRDAKPEAAKPSDQTATADADAKDAEVKDAEAKDAAEIEEPKGPTVPDILAEAERLVAAGRADDAEHLYEGAIAGQNPAIRAHRALFRYELARLLGFEKNEIARARGIFEHLTLTADGEVQTQSAFALCELDLASAPCRAASCLRSIARDASASKSVITEANGLLHRWKLERCDHN